MKKMAIISSYNELCGNATYTEVLRREFAKSYDVKVLGLKVSLLNKTHKVLKKLANQHIEELAEQLRDYDYVNIQFEAGLFGTHPGLIFKRFNKLANASKNLIVTMHRFDSAVSIMDRDMLRALVTFQFRAFFNNAMKCFKYNYYTKLYRKIVKACKDHPQASILVHTKRDKGLIQGLHNFKKVYDHPISFLTKEEISHYKHTASRAEFNKKYQLNDDDVLIGIFGFVSEYKGHHTAIQALHFLPPNYKLLIFGSQHPGAIVRDQLITPYISKLLNLIEPKIAMLDKNIAAGEGPAFTVISSMSLSNRVFFYGGLDDDAFIKAIMCCDYNVLPYVETNQSGSGNASLTLEAGAKAIFSLNYSTIELEKYAPNCFRTFSIGNYIELANCIKNYGEKPDAALNKYLDNYNIHTSVKLYKDIFEGTKSEHNK